MVVANKLALHDMAIILAVKSFIVKAQRTFSSRITNMNIFLSKNYIKLVVCLPLPHTSSLFYYMRARLGAYHYSGVLYKALLW